MSLFVLKAKRYTRLSNETKPQCCGICNSGFTRDDQIYSLPCSHFFHEPCLQMYLAKKTFCPVCKLDLDGGDNHLTPGGSRSGGRSRPKTPERSSQLLRRRSGSRNRDHPKPRRDLMEPPFQKNWIKKNSKHNSGLKLNSIIALHCFKWLNRRRRKWDPSRDCSGKFSLSKWILMFGEHFRLHTTKCELLLCDSNKINTCLLRVKRREFCGRWKTHKLKGQSECENLLIEWVTNEPKMRNNFSSWRWFL